METKIYENNRKLYDSLEADIRNARSRILIESYIFYPDATGRRFVRLLAERARAGVLVRVLLDYVGSFGTHLGFFKELILAGGEVRFFHKTIFHYRFFRDINESDHRKLFVIDDRIAYLGSTNIYDNGLEYTEFTVRLSGAETRVLRNIFYENYHRRDKRRLIPHRFQKPLACGPYTIFRDLPGIISPILHQAYRLFKSARHEIIVASPYPVFGLKLRARLVALARRGVKISLIFPHRSDIRIVDLFRYRYFGQLLSAGCRLYAHTGPFLHGKAILVDGRTALISSSNFDYRSVLFNYELAVSGSEPALTDPMARIMKRLIATAKPYTLADWNRRSYWQRLMEAILSPIRRLL